MLTILQKELKNFLNSLIGTIVVSVFLIIAGLFLWVFPGSYHIIDSGYANLQGLFDLAPYILLFIVPAITMRFFAEEMKTGTIEMLLTKPITESRIIMAKWLAGTLLVLFALIPTLVYYVTISLHALPPGIDAGGTWGSYLGLLFLGGVFVSIGLFASAITDNQIVSFVLAFFISGFAFIGFELIHALGLLGQTSLFVRNLGIQAHYESMSRGVIDSRDLFYFLGLTALFLLFTKIKLESRKWGGKLSGNVLGGKPTKDLRKKHLLQLISGILLIILVNLGGTLKFVRLDLTAEKRHSLSDASKTILKELGDRLYIRVYLEGEFPAGFKQLRNQTAEVLNEFRAYTDMIQYEFVNPAKTGDSRQVRNYYDMLISKGLQPAQIQVRADDASSQQLIFPGAILRYNNKEVAVQLLQDQIGSSLEEVLNNSAQLLEYNLINAIRQLVSTEKPVVAFLEGYGEPSPQYLADVTASLRQFYELGHIRLDGDIDKLSGVRTLLIVQPVHPFPETDKYIIDQFIMNGGSVLWLVDPVFASMDSLQVQGQQTMGITWPVNLDDMLFNYGVRLNANLLLDLQSAPIAVTTGVIGDRPQISLVPWPYFPLLSPSGNHPVVRNLNLIRSEFVSSIDTVEVPGIKKTFLLKTSPYTRTMAAPVIVDLRMMQDPVNEQLFTGPERHVAVLLEGSFQSLFRNRINPAVRLPVAWNNRESSYPTSMIVVADGDLIKNQFNASGQPLPLGYDRYSGEMFGNKDFVVNAVDYLTDNSGIIAARNKEIRLRLLDKTSINQRKHIIQLINVVLPVVFVFILGLIRMLFRKWRYAGKSK